MKLTLTKTQIEALQNGATAVILPIVEDDIKDLQDYYNNNPEISHIYYSNPEKTLLELSPTSKGDKDVWIAEEFCDVEYYDPDFKERRVYRSDSDAHMFDIHPGEWKQMTKDQSRYSIDVGDVRVVKVDDISTKDWLNIATYETLKKVYNTPESIYEKIMQEMNINRTYKDNDYVFLIEHTGLKNV